MTGLVAVDIGNSFMHLGRFPLRQQDTAALPPWLPWEGQAAPGVVQIARVEQLRAEIFPATPLWWSVASVHRGQQQQLAAWVAEHRPLDVYHLLSHEDFGLPIAVQAPERIGRDRLASAVTANRLRAPEHGAIIVDAGTAITVDLVDRTGCFLGGAILPGLRMASLALAEQTDALPQVKLPHEPPPPCGTSTEAAIQSGLYWGAVGGVRELIARLQEQRRTENETLDVFATGGDADHTGFLSQLQATLIPDMALLGAALVGQRLAAIWQP